MSSHGVTASNASSAANSRLSLMQMRFQQKQQQEREQRRLELTEEVGSPTEEKSGPKAPISNGKVRQMFDERRRGAGIDRANPLKPIVAAKPKPSPAVSRATGGALPATITMRSKQSLTTLSSYKNGNISNISATTARRNSVKHLQNGNTDAIVKEMSSLSLGAHHPLRHNDRNNNNNNNNNHDEPDSLFARGQSSNSLKLKPVVTKKSPSPIVSSKRPTPTSSTVRQTVSTGRPLSRTTSSAVKTPPKKSTSNMSASNTGVRQQTTSHDSIAAGVGTCRFCNRHFNFERLGKHEKICEKMIHTKRKIFDAARHRLRGTDAEKYLKKSQSRNSAAIKQSYTSAAAVTGLSAGLKKNNWRKKHEEFINAIRAAKQVQAHLARGGKLSELPPPPPSENPDYIQCPHCLRRFNESAAERHIPRCANMLHNKPKPGQQARKR